MDKVTEYRSIINDIRKLMARRMSGAVDGNKIRTEGAFKIVHLKTLNEECQLACKASIDAAERAKDELVARRHGQEAMQYQASRLQRQIDEDRQVKATQIIKPSQLRVEFERDCADQQLKERAKLGEHDEHLAMLEFELHQRRHMNGILKTKQEELLKLKSEIMDKEENLSLLEPGLKQLMESTKPLLSGLELELGSLSEKMQFENFDEEMTDSLMCLYRQCRARQTNKNDVLVKYQGSNCFDVELTGNKLELSYQAQFDCVFIRSQLSLDDIGVAGDTGRHVPNMFGQVACDEPAFRALIDSGWRCYRWLQNMCGIELILTEAELDRCANWESFMSLISV